MRLETFSIARSAFKCIACDISTTLRACAKRHFYVRFSTNNFGFVDSTLKYRSKILDDTTRSSTEEKARERERGPSLCCVTMAKVEETIVDRDFNIIPEQAEHIEFSV